MTNTPSPAPVAPLARPKSTVQRVLKELAHLIGAPAVSLSEDLGRLVVTTSKDVTVPGYPQLAPGALASFANHPAFREMLEQKRQAKARTLERIGDVEHAAILRQADADRWMMVLPDVDGAGMWRVQYFDLSGFSGHALYKGKEAALGCAIGEGFTERDDFALDRIQDSPSFQRGIFATDLIQRINGGRLRRDEGDRLLMEYDQGARALHSLCQSGAQAFIAAGGQTIYLLADRIDEGNEQAVFLHEIVHRYGRSILGAAGWANLLTTLKRWANQPANSVERRVYERASLRAGRAAGDKADLFDEELLAYAVETAVGMGLKPRAMALPDSAERWLDDVSSTLRGVVQHILGGAQLQELDAQQLVDLSYAMAQLESPERTARILERMTDRESVVLRDLLARINPQARAEPAQADPGVPLQRLAPNGQISMLPARLYAAVRTDEFKAWFGDWERDPQNASKALDANGEPKVYYHGSTKAGFSVFDVDGKESTRETGAFFSDSFAMAKGYAGTKDAAPVFLPEALLVQPSLMEDLEVNKGFLVRTKGSSQWDWSFYADIDVATQALAENDGMEVEPGYEVFFEGELIIRGSEAVVLQELGNLPVVRNGVYEVFLNVRDLVEEDWESKSWNEGPTEQVWNFLDEDGEVYDTAYSVQERDLMVAQTPGYIVKEVVRPRHENTNEAAREARGMGADGILIKEVWDTGPFGYAEDGNVMVVFDPRNIKSTENQGSFDSQNDDIRYSVNPAGRLNFYSHLQRVIQRLPQRLSVMTAHAWAQWLAANAGKLGVKADEIEWSGINDYLDLRGQEKLSKDDLSDYLEQGGVQVNETVLVGAVEADSNDAQYGQYALPGGENYREVLLTLPSNPRTLVRYQVLNDDGELVNTVKTEDKAKQLVNGREGFSIKPVSSNDPSDASVFHSSHWRQANVLAHIRITDRTDADGARVLFVEELQSDWGQEGKNKGFAAQPNAARVKEINADLRQLAKADMESDPQWSALTKEKEALTAPGIPLAPFITKTEGWLTLALKRVAMMAVEEGYDKVAFISGEQSSHRYQLSKRVDQLALVGESLLIGKKNGTEVFRKEDISVKQLADFIGKDAAEKLSNAAKKTNLSGSEVRVISGEDLRMGGEGMKTFYDTIVPQTLAKLLPKLGGVGRGGITVETKRDPGQVKVESRFTPEGMRYQLCFSKAGETSFSEARPVSPDLYETFSAANEAKREMLADKERLRTAQGGFDITPKMREIVSAGLPLFSMPEDAAAQPQDEKRGPIRRRAERSAVRGVVYHATRSDFTSFDVDRSDLGAHFGTIEQANRIATGMRLDNGEGTQIMPVRLSLLNPIRLKDVGSFHADGIAAQLEKKGLLPKGEGKRIAREVDANFRLRKKYDPMLRKILLDAGYDGVVYANTQEGKGDSYIAFHPEQIKSAIGNNGEYDASNPDIRFSVPDDELTSHVEVPRHERQR